MRTQLFLASVSLLASLPAQGPAARDPAHPLPPTASTLVSTPPQLPPVREAAPPMAPRPAPLATPLTPEQKRMRTQRRPEGSFDPLPAAVMFDRPEAGGPLWAIGADWKMSVDGRGFTFIPFFGADAPRNFPVRLELARVTVGGELVSLPEGQPVETTTRVRTERGTLVEVLDLGLEEVEQSFVFATLPNRGAIAVDVAMTSELACEARDDGLVFGNEHGRVSYAKAVAVDAAGARLPLDITWTGSAAHIEIPASFVARAQLPLVLDPLLTTNGSQAPGQTQLQRDPDVATIQSAGGRSLVIWRRQWSATDQDCWGSILDASLAAVAGPFTLDFSGLDWLAPAVAANDYAQNFLVVSEIRTGTLHYIGGRTVTAAGFVGSLFDIERDAVVGLPGNNFRPDVGGDPFQGFAAYFAVVFEKQVGASNDIYLKLVRQDGTLLTTNPTALDTSTTAESNPTISKSNGGAGGANYWFVAWQRTWPNPPFDEEVIGAMVNWSGSVPVPSIYIAGNVANETAPTTSSPVDIAGTRYWMVCHELASAAGQQRDIIAKVYDNAGALVSSAFNVSQAEAVGTYASYDQQTPDVDSDGARFAVAYAEPWGGTSDLETKVSTLAWDPSITTVRIDEERVGLGLSFANEATPRICANHSGGALPSSSYVIVESNDGPNDIQTYAYGGYVPGTFFSYYPTECGTLSITPSGTPALGDTVSFTVGNGLASATIFGFPGYISLLPIGCNCVQGVDPYIYMGNPLVWTVPTNPIYVGTTLSVQGFTIVGTQCLGFIDLSDTVDFSIR